MHVGANIKQEQAIQKTVGEWPSVFADSSKNRGVSRMSLISWQEISLRQQNNSVREVLHKIKRIKKNEMMNTAHIPGMQNYQESSRDNRKVTQKEELSRLGRTWDSMWFQDRALHSVLRTRSRYKISKHTRRSLAHKQLCIKLI